MGLCVYICGNLYGCVCVYLCECVGECSVDLSVALSMCM